MVIFCPLCSGSSGNAAYYDGGGVRLLIDAGISCRRITALLQDIGVDPGTLDAILVTHEHSDHIQGVRVVSDKYGVPVYAAPDCWIQMRMSGHFVPPARMRVFEPDAAFYLGNVRVLPFTTPHDSAHAVGFSLETGGKKVTLMTDIGCVTGHMLDVAAGSDLLLMESNHDVDMLKAGSYPYPLKQRILSKTGHLSNEDAGLAAVKLFGRGVRNVILGHLSQENNTKELALLTVESVLEDAGVLEAMHVVVAERDHPCGVYELT